MKHPYIFSGLAAAVLILFSSAAYANVKVASIFNSNMVLPREKPVPVWGTADPGEAVEVTFAGQTLKTKANKFGKWQIILAPMKVSTQGRAMILKGKNRVTLKNILVGDLWLCGGQSNMVMPVSAKLVDGAKHIKEAANLSLLRHIKLRAWNADDPAENVTVQYNWNVCNSKNVTRWTATGYYFARRIYLESGVPIGLIDANVNGCPIDPFVAPMGFQGIPGLKHLWRQRQPFIPGTPAYKKRIQKNARNYRNWAEEAELALKKGEPAPAMPVVMKTGHLSSFYNSLMAPYTRLPIKGAIWYQGCSNIRTGMAYTYMMEALINGWRAAWKDDFPFYYVQLAAYQRATTDPKGGNGFAVIREAQRLAMRIPKTGMVCAIDIGMQNDIHPRNKYDAGERLALWALRDVYGKKNTVVSGPLFRRMEINGNKIVLSFDYAKGLMTAKKTGLAKAVPVKAKPAHFAIAGANKVWYWADAKIEGEKVIVSSPEVQKPVAVRYAYRAYPDGVNMYNAAGLPMVPFRTDDWK